MLRTAMGVSIATWLADPQVIEIMLNPDGRLWVDRLGIGLSDSGERLAAKALQRPGSRTAASDGRPSCFLPRRPH